MSTEPQPNPAEQPLRSVYTSGLPQIFAQLGISLGPLQVNAQGIGGALFNSTVTP